MDNELLMMMYHVENNMKRVMNNMYSNNKPYYLIIELMMMSMEYSLLVLEHNMLIGRMVKLKMIDMEELKK